MFCMFCCMLYDWGEHRQLFFDKDFFIWKWTTYYSASKRNQERVQLFAVSTIRYTYHGKVTRHNCFSVWTLRNVAKQSLNVALNGVKEAILRRKLIVFQFLFHKSNESFLGFVHVHNDQQYWKIDIFWKNKHLAVFCFVDFFLKLSLISHYKNDCFSSFFSFAGIVYFG